MQEVLPEIVAGLFAIAVAILTAYLTAMYKTRRELDKERGTRHLDIVMQQKFEYFLRFKYCADEFCRRLSHIESRLYKNHEKYNDMVQHFNQKFESKTADWYYNDEPGPEGGYFLTSTVYMNCILFYWMKRIQWEYPFISLVLDRASNKVREKLQEHFEHERLPRFDYECDVYDFIKSIKVTIAGRKAIPYSLQDSFGDFIYNYESQRIINYDEFCSELINNEKKRKFGPLLDFWTGIVTPSGEIDSEKIFKIRGLILILETLKFANIRE